MHTIAVTPIPWRSDRVSRSVFDLAVHLFGSMQAIFTKALYMTGRVCDPIHGHESRFDVQDRFICCFIMLEKPTENGSCTGEKVLGIEH